MFLPAALLCLLAALPVRVAGIEVRGTLLCRPEGDARRERVVESPCLIVEPVGRPESTELLDEAGLFRVQLREWDLDRMLVLRIHRGRKTIDLIRTYLDARSVQTQAGLYVLDAHVLPDDCESLSCLPEVALDVRDSLRAGAVARADSTTRMAYRKVAPAAVLAALVGVVPALPGLFGSPLGAGNTAASPGGDSLLSVSVDTLDVAEETSSSLPPGQWPALARLSSSPSLGRSITGWQDAAELSLWNPSALPLGRRSGIAVGGGSPRELRAAVWVRGATRPGHGNRYPGSVSIGFARRDTDRTVDVRFSDGSELTRTFSLDERLLVAGIGFSPIADLSIGSAVRVHRIRSSALRGVERTTRTFLDEDAMQYEAVTRRTLTRDFESERVGVDVGCTWDPSSSHRVAAVVHDVGEARFERMEGVDSPPREWILGYQTYASRLRAGLETSLRSGDTDVSGGLSVRVVDALWVDLAAGSRFETIQTGIDLRINRFRLRGRLRSDQYDSTAATAGLTIGF